MSRRPRGVCQLEARGIGKRDPHCLAAFGCAACLRRARMTPAELAAWEAEDDRAFAAEAAFDAGVAILEGWAPPLGEPVETPLVIARGGRFGRLLLLYSVLQPRRDGFAQRMWRCRCDCGRETEVSASRLRRGTRQCRACSNAATAHARAKRFGSATVLELAAAAGLPWQTIWTRIRRGVPVEQLTGPRRRPPTHGGRRRAA